MIYKSLAFLQSYDSTPPLPSAISLSFSVFPFVAGRAHWCDRVGVGGGRGVESYTRKKAWTSKIRYSLSVPNHLSPSSATPNYRGNMLHFTSFYRYVLITYTYTPLTPLLQFRKNIRINPLKIVVKIVDYHQFQKLKCNCQRSAFFLQIGAWVLV